MPSPQVDFLVVGVGASAGGLEALERLFSSTPADLGAAFVVVQHLSPDFESRMDELLSRQTTLPIHLVTDGIPVEPNAVYLIPPRKDMIISGGRLLLTDKDDVRGFSLPIDHFFRSLAHDVRRRAVAVVLSGAGSDGARGLRDVHEAGGLVIAQDPESARFQGMPVSAKQTGLVDLVLRPEEIPAAIARHASSAARFLDEVVEENPPPTDGTAMEEILRLLRNEYGIEFSLYKPSTVVRRIERRVALNNHRDLDAYAEILRQDPEELNALYRDLLIGVTRFFRDPEAFERLETDVIPRILAAVPPDEEIRCWVPACATGEEAYSIAMVLHEQLEAAHRPLNARIFATDVHRSSLDAASAGLYDETVLADLKPSRRQRYFARDGHRFRVAKELRQIIVFARHNVITDAPFTRLDLVSCRNLLIYLQPPVQKKVLTLFHFGLKTGSVLVLGPSESPGELADEFDSLDAHWRMFTKRRDRPLVESRLPITVQGRPPIEPSGAHGRAWPGPQLLAVYDQLLDKEMPPSVLVDENYHLVHTFGGAERLLRVRPGRPSMNVLDLVDDGLRAALLGALQRAEKERTIVRYSGITLRSGDGESFRLVVEPLAEGRTAMRHYLVRLEPSPPLTAAAGPTAPAEENRPHDYVAALETELRFAKESLQATIEELETSNEELQATNEELVASNEELQSTNEELHSVNEELYTVNVEHQRKIAQLTELTDDLDNLLHSLEVGVLFVDDQLCIRKFTAHMARLFRLLPQDVGRRFDSFAHTINHPDLETEVEQVLRTREPIEHEVTARDGTIHLLRVLPYRNQAQKGGVVVTLIDIGALKRSEARVRRLSAIVESSTDAILGKDLDGRITSWNRGAELLYGYDAEEAIGRHVSFLLPPERRPEVDELLAAVRRGETLEPFESVRIRKDGTPLDVWVTVSPIHDEHNRVTGASTIARDITQRKRSDAEIRRALQMRDQFMAMLSHELRNPLAALMHGCSILRRPDIDAERHERALAAVERQCRHMARLLDDVLDVSRMRQDGIELYRRRVDVRTPIERAVESVTPAAEATDVTLRVELGDAELAVNGDPDRLQQVWANLLANAVKYSPAGREARLTVGIEEGRAVVRIRDQGIGIPPHMLERIFEPFVRAVDDEYDHSRARGGMGLGLALVRSIVRAHGGEVRAESAGPGQGSELIVALPLAGPEANDEPRDRVDDRPQRLVLVEDQEDSRELLAEILRHAGYEVVTAEGGLTGLEAILRVRPDVALIDLGLPELPGVELARRARRDVGETVFLVALTGYGQQHDREAVLSAGFDQHLVKPIDTSTLLEVLRTRRRLEAAAALPPGNRPDGRTARNR